MRPFRASSPQDLVRELHANDVQVPPRSRGRTTAHGETWVTCRFLAAVSESGLLDYPLAVTPGDRPDLVLSSVSGRTGIEITEAVPTDEARVDALSEREGIEDFRFVPRYRAGENRRSVQEIEDIARGRVPTYPHPGGSMERDWVEAMLYFVGRKADRFVRPGFAKHDRNWLLIYNNWSPTAGLNDQAAMTALDRELRSHDGASPFDRIFILRSHDVVWDFSRGAAAVTHRVIGSLA